MYQAVQSRMKMNWHFIVFVHFAYFVCESPRTTFDVIFMKQLQCAKYADHICRKTFHVASQSLAINDVTVLLVLKNFVLL